MATYYPSVISAIKKVSATTAIGYNATRHAGIGVVSNKLYVNTNNSVGLFNDIFCHTNSNVGTKNGSTVSVVEYGLGGFLHQTVFTLTATPITMADATAGGGVKIYDFPLGVITVLAASGSVAETTTSTLASTLNAGVTYNWGVGTTVQANGTLATTEQDWLPSTNGTASATINVAGAASGAVRTAAPAQFDGTATAIDLYLNAGVATGTDIDADASTTWTGTITITWLFTPDV